MKCCCRYFKIAFFSFFILLPFNQCFGQSYGLGFFSHESIADKRTSLELFPQQELPVSGNFTLSFELSFLPDRSDYFGYIFRIIEGGKRNIDFIYDKTTLKQDSLKEDPNHFKLIVGDSFTKIGFNLKKSQLVNHWNRIALTFDFDHDRLILTVNDKATYRMDRPGLSKNSAYKFFFGVNDYQNFKLLECPPFKVRDIKLTIDQTLKYHWPLDGISGSVAHEIVNNANGQVTNPLWLKASHVNWSLIKSVNMKGIASTAFSAGLDNLYIVGSDSLLTFRVNTGATTIDTYRNGKMNLLLSNQSVFDEHTHTLYNYYVDRNHRIVSTFDPQNKSWDKNYDFRSIPMIDFLGANNFVSPADSSLYILGGYGHFSFHNDIQRYHLPDGQWKDVARKGDPFFPRYLSALGVADSGRTTYILGGYGSRTGRQMLNPKNFYDLLRYDVLKKTFKKVYDLGVAGEDFTFANSMVIDEKAQTFSALVFPNNHFNSHLRLLIGSLKHPGYQLIGSEIPYSFKDVKSFANLYYSQATQQLLAVTLYRTADDRTQVNIYALSSPPAIIAAATKPVSSQKWWLIMIGGVIVLALIIVVLYRKKRPNPEVIKQVEDQPVMAEEIVMPEEALPLNNELNQNAIMLFGDLRLCTADGQDITKHFTLLIKELFLTIFINSVRSGRGISPEKLVELLWFDKSEESAKNNRSANLSRLKNLLVQIDGVNLTKDSGNWKIMVDFDKVYVDYHQYLQLMGDKKKISSQKIASLMNITRRGNFLANMEYPWLDHIKSEVSNEVIDTYLNYTRTLQVASAPETLIAVANCIFDFDLVNEDAMVLKCKALAYLGKHSLAKSTFLTFCKEYQDLYAEPFKKDFQSVLDQQ